MSAPARTHEPRVPLLRLWRKQSAKGTYYFAGRLGLARVLGFEGKDESGESVLDLVVVERREQATPPRDGDPQQRARQQPLAEAAHPRSAWRGASSGENPFD